MNLAFKLQDDKELTWEDFQPGKIVSLWDMLEFYAVVFINVCTQLATWENIIQTEIDNGVIHVGDRLKVNPPDDMRESFSGIRTELEKLHLTNSMRFSEDIISFINSEESLDAQELRHLFRCFRSAFIYELDERKILMVSSSRARYYKCKGTFLGEEITSKLEFLIRDANEAGNCFALGRYTACVFHLMRIAEYMNQKFAKELGIVEIETRKGPLKVEDATWQNLYNHINNCVNGTSKTQPSVDKNLREKCNKLLSLVGPLREVRNPIMHSPGDFYTSENAETYMICLRSFTKQFLEVFPQS